MNFPYEVEEYNWRGREVEFINSKRLFVTLMNESDTKVVHVWGGTRRPKIPTEGWYIRWKHWKITPKTYVFDICVYFFWAHQPQECYYVENYDVMSRTREVSLTLSTENRRDVSIRGKLHELTILDLIDIRLGMWLNDGATYWPPRTLYTNE